MAQIEVTGLAEVLADHEDKIAAAQAWCVRKNIGSIQQLKEKGAATVDEFIVCGAPSSTPSAGSAPKDSATELISNRTTNMTLD